MMIVLSNEMWFRNDEELHVTTFRRMMNDIIEGLAINLLMMGNMVRGSEKSAMYKIV